MDTYMRTALDEACRGLAEGGIPIGSVLVHEDVIIGRGRNRRVQRGSTVLQSPECIALMQGFIQESLALWNEDIGE